MHRKKENFLFVRLKIGLAYGMEYPSAGPFGTEVDRAWFIIHMQKLIEALLIKYHIEINENLHIKLVSYQSSTRGSARKSSWTPERWIKDVESHIEARNKKHKQ